MTREQVIQRYARIWYWEDLLKTQFSVMNLEFQEIVFIEEILPYINYIGFVKVKSHSKQNEFIEVMVSFNKKGRGTINIHPRILHSIEDEIAGGKVLLNKLNR
jgi:hypothetical protein